MIGDPTPPPIPAKNDIGSDTRRLLQKGFRRHFWKSLFASSLDGLAIQASSSNSPTHLGDSVCGGGAKSTVRPSVKSKVVRIEARDRGAAY